MANKMGRKPMLKQAVRTNFKVESKMAREIEKAAQKQRISSSEWWRQAADQKLLRDSEDGNPKS